MLVYSSLSVKYWLQNLPSIDEVRPYHCPSCKISYYQNSAFTIHGHGTRERYLVDVDENGVGKDIIILFRRFRCTNCGTVISIIPSGLVTRRRYTVAAMVLAFYFWGIEKLSESHVRKIVSPTISMGHGTLEQWPVLRRWVKCAKQIFGSGVIVYGNHFREQAAAIVRWISAHAPPDMHNASLREQLIKAACSLAF